MYVPEGVVTVGSGLTIQTTLTTWMYLCSSEFQISNVLLREVKTTTCRIPKLFYILLHMSYNVIIGFIKMTGFLGDTRWIKRKEGRFEDRWG